MSSSSAPGSWSARASTRRAARCGRCATTPCRSSERLAQAGRAARAAFATSGPPRPLAPETVLALYRVAQEALTNVMKHATGATASMELAFDDDAVRLTVDNDVPSTNGAASDALGHSGGGFGLRGISERVALLGGEVDAGPVPGGWRVHAVVPAAGAAPTTPAPTPDPLAS